MLTSGSAKKFHLLQAVAEGKHGEIRFDLLCPFTVGEERPCRMGMEPEGRCDWYDYELGEHYEACPARASGKDEDCLAPEGSQTGCWPEEPEECPTGFESTEIGHVHETAGCWAQQLIADVGWDRAVQMKMPDGVHQLPLALPMAVHLTCDDEFVTLAPLTPTESMIAQFGLQTATPATTPWPEHLLELERERQRAAARDKP